MPKFKLADFLRRWDGMKPEDKMAATTCLEMKKISGGGEEASDAILLLTSKQSEVHTNTILFVTTKPIVEEENSDQHINDTKDDKLSTLLTKPQYSPYQASYKFQIQMVKSK